MLPYAATRMPTCADVCRRMLTYADACRHAFITPRDLFKWADRLAAAATDTYELMAQEGYMLLAEGLRRPEEKTCVQDVLEKVSY